MLLALFFFLGIALVIQSLFASKLDFFSIFVNMAILTRICFFFWRPQPFWNFNSANPWIWGKGLLSSRMFFRILLNFFSANTSPLVSSEDGSWDLSPMSIYLQLWKLLFLTLIQGLNTKLSSRIYWKHPLRNQEETSAWTRTPPWSFLFCFFFFCFVFVFVFRDRVSLSSPGCSGTHSVDQTGLRNRPASASQLLGLKACATTPGQGSSHKGKHLIGAGIHVQKLSPVSTRWEAWQHRGRLGAGGAKSSTSWSECGQEKTDSSALGGPWALGALKPHMKRWHTPSDKATPTPTRPHPLTMSLPVGQAYSNHHSLRQGLAM